ncbi:MAG: hypothetical protein HYY46_24800 [Deltaproteobacteria bacterium]|nr:hypothetical protein [Deltaproteobacteria bacterium]
MAERCGLKKMVNILLLLTWSVGIVLFSQFTLAALPGESDAGAIEEAREEEAVGYTTMTLSRNEQVDDRCQKKYPFLRVDSIQGGGALPSKIQAEGPAGRRARRIASGLGC